MKYEETARRLKKALSDNDMKAQELADKCGINKASISQYVNGSHKPSNIKAALMADVLGVNALWLMGFDSFDNEENQLSEKDKNILNAFNELTPENQRHILEMMAYFKDKENRK